MLTWLPCRMSKFGQKHKHMKHVNGCRQGKIKGFIPKNLANSIFLIKLQLFVGPFGIVDYHLLSTARYQQKWFLNLIEIAVWIKLHPLINKPLWKFKTAESLIGPISQWSYNHFGWIPSNPQDWSVILPLNLLNALKQRSLTAIFHGHFWFAFHMKEKCPLRFRSMERLIRHSGALTVSIIPIAVMQ